MVTKKTHNVVMDLQLPLQIQNKKNMDLLLAILISMGINVTPKDLTNKEFMLKNQSAIQHAQGILKERQTESTRITFKAAPQTNIFKQSKN